MELKNVNPNGEKVVASNLNNIKLLIIENCENLVQNQTLYVIFSIRCHDCPKNKNHYIVYLTNQH
jgi:hypothetical protein